MCMWQGEQQGDSIMIKTMALTTAITILEAVYIGCPKQALVLARSGDHGDYENIFFRKIMPAL